MESLGFAATLFSTTVVFCGPLLRAQRHEVVADGYVVNGKVVVRRVRVCGVVVGREERRGTSTLVVDDGTGTVACVVFAGAGAGVVASSAATTTSRIRLGDLVSVKGRVSDFRGVRQIAVDVVERVKDVNYEFAWHLHVIHMHNTIYAAAANPLPAHLAPDLLLAKAAEADAAEYASDALLDVTVESLDSRKLKLQSAIHKYNSLERRDIPSLAFVIKAYIEYHQFTTVEFDMVVGDPILSSLSESFLKQSSRNPNASISSIQLRLLFAKLFAVLVKEGFMFKSMTGNTQEDSYQLIRHDLNLGDAVFNAIVKCCGGKSSNGCWKEFADTGVPHDMIGLVVREKTDYRNVSNSQIQRSLKILQTQSMIIEVIPRHFSPI